MNRAKVICKYPGCPELLDSPGYCPRHTISREEKIARNRARFAPQDNKKTPDQRRFYSSKAWTETSKNHRILEPLCRRCREAGKVVPGALVHHNPPREFLVANGLNPLDERFLETLCISCHQRELREKKTI